jgi:hypothetical protein
MRLFLLLLALPVWAADDANAILRRYLEADSQNDKKATQYTYVEDRAWFVRGKNGELHRNRSETAEVIFIEGEAFRKLVARNGKPLDAKEQARVDKKMRETAEQRRRHRTGRMAEESPTATLAPISAPTRSSSRSSTIAWRAKRRSADAKPG